MVSSEVVTRQNGIGYLVLKNGSSRQVKWEIDLLHDHSLGSGCIRGDEKHLKAAAKDGCANLRLSINTTAAIIIDQFKHGKVSFTTLLTSSETNVFDAQTIVGSSPILESSKVSIEFSDADGQRLRLCREWRAPSPLRSRAAETADRGGPDRRHERVEF